MDHQIVSVTRIPSGGYAYFQPAIYTAIPRLDGVVTWRRTSLVCEASRSEAKAHRAALVFAEDSGLTVDFTVRHGRKVRRARVVGYARVPGTVSAAPDAETEGGVE